jgi:hypothetical protein
LIAVSPRVGNGLFEDGIRRKIFGVRRGEVTAEWNKLNLEMHTFYCSSDIIVIIKTRRMPITVAACSKALTAFAHSDAGIMCSIPAQDMDV